MRTWTATFPVFTLGRERLQDGKNFGYFQRYPLDILFPSDCSSARPLPTIVPQYSSQKLTKKKKMGTKVSRVNEKKELQLDYSTKMCQQKKRTC